MAKQDSDLQKLTLTIPADVVERAKLAAVRRRTSVSKEVTEFLRTFGAGEGVTVSPAAPVGKEGAKA